MPRKVILRISRGDFDDNAVWFMRQAGRYIPEYEEIKRGRKFSDILADEDAIYRLSILPMKYIKTDGIVMFTDILVPLRSMGFNVTYENGIEVTKEESVSPFSYNGLSSAIKRVSENYGDMTIIGVMGGPFTTLSYVYDKGRSGYHLTKREVLEKGDVLLSNIIESILGFGKLQADSGVDVIQIFDSWLGSLSETFYEMHVRKWEEYFVEKVKELGKPVIFFSEGASHLSDVLSRLDVDVFSVDWRRTLGKYASVFNNHAIQGNLDPNLLDSPDLYLKKEVRRIMNDGKLFRGHVFNLGHGVPYWADWKKLSMIANEVHSYER
ncbi:MAG: uroporphyrinogen decarboxylase family protein [Thermoplasmatales archaeon]